MPQKAVAPAGNVHGHAGLGIAVGQLQGAALPVQVFFLVLAHAVNVFAVRALEGSGQGIVAAQDGFKLPGVQHQRVFPVGFL